MSKKLPGPPAAQGLDHETLIKLSNAAYRAQEKAESARRAAEDALRAAEEAKTAADDLAALVLDVTGVPITNMQLETARVHWDLLRAIRAGAGHSRQTSPGVGACVNVDLLEEDETDLAKLTPAGRRALAIVLAERKG